MSKGSNVGEDEARDMVMGGRARQLATLNGRNGRSTASQGAAVPSTEGGRLIDAGEGLLRTSIVPSSKQTRLA